MFFETFQNQSISQLMSVFNPSSRIYAFYLITSLVLAFLVYWRVEKANLMEDIAEGNPVHKRVGFLSYVFDPKIWLHPSSIQDMKYFIANSILFYGLIAQFMIGAHTLSYGFHDIFVGLFGAPQTAILTGPLALALYTLLSVIALDFGVFLMHYYFHKVPILWHFHKVHHSAEQLNPMTLFRMHPVDLMLTALSVMFFQGLAYAGMFFLTASPPDVYTILGLNFVTFFFYLLGYNLRHSHIWLNYPVWLSKIFISPAQHQIHHSSDPKHFDRNMGLIFSFWDQMFGTHYIPVAKEKLTFGLSRQDPNPFKSVKDIYVLPFVWAWGNVSASLSTPRRRSIAYTGALTVLLAGFAFQNHVKNIKDAAPPSVPSVKLERLTWTEVKTAIANGYVNEIIPKGGTEQSGPFLALGKHNIIIDKTSHDIAHRVGKTLVTPVMAYVPEGDIEPKPSGHMPYAGTLTLSEDVFEQVLEQTAASLKLHGFKNIFLLADSGDSQDAQNRVASRLNSKWAAEGIQVFNLDEYYYKNGQTEYLLEQGHTKEEIGMHAGIRDTSEIMALKPTDFRLREGNLLKGTDDQGIAGNPYLASARIGQQMLQLKIDAGVAQMKRLLGSVEIATVN
ncbi:MAG: creatininase family protein [Salaquimonas sp.]